MQPTPVTRVCYLSPILFDQSSYVISPHPARHKRHGRAVPKYSTVGYSIFKVHSVCYKYPSTCIGMKYVVLVYFRYCFSVLNNLEACCLYTFTI